MCVSVNGPGNPDLWPFDLETNMRVASKVENLPSKFGHDRAPLGSRIIRYVRDGRTDKSKAYCPLPNGPVHNKAMECMILLNNVMRRTSITLIHISIGLHIGFLKPFRIQRQLDAGMWLYEPMRTVVVQLHFHDFE